MDFCLGISWVPSIQVLYIHLHKPFKRSVEFSVHCVVWVSFLSKFGWEGLMTCLIKILISSWLQNQIGWGFRLFAEMQIISYTFSILKHIQIGSQFRNILMLKVRLPFLFEGDNLYIAMTMSLIDFCVLVSIKGSGSHLQSQNVRLDKSNGM